MRDYRTVLSASPLFSGMDAAELDSLLRCLNGRRRRYRQEEAILLAGAPVGQVGLLLEGRAQIQREEFTGERSILADVRPGELFAEAFACAPDSHPHAKTLPVTVMAVTESVALFIDYRRIIAACPHHSKLIENMLGVLALKNIQLNRKIGHLSKRSTREKLLSYLSEQAAAQGKDTFTIPFNRQQLADYLCVERSAMSAVLCRLRDEGALRFDKNRFTLNRRALAPRDEEPR